jgi:hypothetical protein
MADRRLHGILPAAAIGGMLLAPIGETSQAQERRMMVFDDGAGPHVVHVSGPDIRQLRTPDFVRKDLPIFNEELELNEMQRLVVQVLLETYLDAFRALASEALPAPPSPMLGMAMGDPGPDGEGGESLDEAVRDALRSAGGEGEGDIDIDFHAQGPVAIQIEARAGTGAGEFHEEDDAGPMEGEDVDMVWAGVEDEEAGTGASVVIAVAGPDGVELPEEVKEQLAAKAQEMAEKIMQRIEEAEFEGGFELEGFDAEDAMEQRKLYFEQMRKSSEKFARTKEGLKQDFIMEVQSQLTAEQIGLWPGFDRALTRVKTLPSGRLDGERTNLLKVVDGLELGADEQQAVAGALEAYELSLHTALVERNEYVEEANVKLDKAIQEGRFDRAKSIAGEAARRRVAVRTVNEESTEAIAARLIGPTAETFRKTALRQSYPRVYRRTAARKAFETVRKLDGLDDETRESIEAIETAYAAELGPLNERIRETIHRYQPRESREMIERLQAMMEGEGGPSFDLGADDPVRALLKRRTELDERYMKQLHALLSPEQIERLPKLPSQVRREPVIIRRSTTPD